MDDIKALRGKVKDLKLLFVDDEKDVRDGTGIFLRKFFNDVAICSDGDEALETFRTNGDFDIVITDILMPRMDGITMVKEIKKIDSDIFIIFLTASRGVESLDENLSNITLQKPLSFEDMIVVMKQLSELK